MSKSPVEKLRVWQESMILAKDVYECTRAFPKDELYCLTSQMRRCAVSIPSNIAEGSQRGTDKDFAHFLIIAMGSWAELKTQILLARELSHLSASSAEKLLSRMYGLGKQLGALHAKLSSAKPVARS